MSILISPKDTIDISVVAAKGDNGKHYCALSDAPKSATQSWPEDLTKTEYHFSFRIPDFKMSTDLLGLSVEVVDGKVKINGSTLRYNRLVKTMCDWSLVDDQGEKIPVNEKNIAKLPPVVATILNEALDDRFEF